jgi:hypothetical protein
MKWAVTTSKGISEISVPDGWDAMPAAMYQKLASEWDGSDLIRLFSILSGHSYKALYNSKDRELESGLIAATHFIYEQKPAFKEQDCPKVFKYNGREIPVPKDLASLSIGQNIHIYQRLTTAKCYDELISLACAVYLQPEIDNSEFNSERAFKIEKEIEAMPVTEVYPLGFFLLRPLIKSGQILQRKGRNILSRLYQDWSKSVRLWREQQRQSALRATAS